MSVKVNAIDHLVINVSDAAHWYQKVLGMEVKTRPSTSLVPQRC